MSSSGTTARKYLHSFKRADALIIVGTNQYRFDTFPSHLKIIRSTLKPVKTGMNWNEGKYIAFAGIADPKKFLTLFDH